MDFYTILEYAHLKAIRNALNPNWDSIYRARCRQYSKEFNTPLHVVQEELDPLMVLEALAEEQYTPKNIIEDLESILEILYTIKDPNYEKISKQDLEELVDNVINREAKRLSKGKASEKNAIENKIKKVEAKPKSGGMNFEDLEKIESVAEFNKSGFPET